MSRSKRFREWRSYETATKELFGSAVSDEAVSVLFADSDETNEYEPCTTDGVQPIVNDEDANSLPADDTSDGNLHFSDNDSEISTDLEGGCCNLDQQSFKHLFQGCQGIFSERQQMALRDEIADWAAQHRVTRDAGNDILKLLNTIFPMLPKDMRTLLHTSVSVTVVQKVGGDYIYFGLLKSLVANKLLDPTTPCISIQLNVDGVPLYSSSAEGFWPILMSVNGSNPVAVCLYYGDGKPTDVTDFLADFVEEYTQLSQGFEHEGTTYSFVADSFICDAPARAFVKCTVSHNGIDACERCCARGKWKSGRVCFDDFTADLRTDQDFAQQRYDDSHQTGVSPLAAIFPCVSGFPLDYMHLVCLGVMRRIVKFWKTEKTSCGRLSHRQQSQISGLLEQLHGQMPSEFARQPRSLAKSDRWKATEWRQFVLYTGMVVLKNVLPLCYFHNFMCLCVAISILLDDDDETRMHYLYFAQQLLVSFVKDAKRLYGETFVTYNVHSLIHLADDCRNFGKSLNSLSAFPYENYLGQLKRLVRNKTNPIAQVARRLSERHDLVGRKELKMKIATNHRDGVVLLKSGEIGFVESRNGDVLTMRMVPKQRFVSAFSTPIDSLCLGIGKVQKSCLADMPVRRQRMTDVAKKLVCLSLEGQTSFTLIPVHHQ